MRFIQRIKDYYTTKGDKVLIAHSIALMRLISFIYIVVYVLYNPDRVGTWLGHLLLNIRLILGEC